MRFLTVDQVSAISTIPRKTLWGWANRYGTQPVGPEPVRLGPRQLRYRLADVSEWLGLTEDELVARMSADAA